MMMMMMMMKILTEMKNGFFFFFLNLLWLLFPSTEIDIFTVISLSTRAVQNMINFIYFKSFYFHHWVFKI